LAKAIEDARQAVDETRQAWPFSAGSEEAYLREQYLDELLTHGEKAGLQMHRRETGLLVPPCVVRVLPNERAVRIGTRRLSTLRPSILIANLRTTQAEKPKVNSQRFFRGFAFSVPVNHTQGSHGARCSVGSDTLCFPVALCQLDAKLHA